MWKSILLVIVIATSFTDVALGNTAVLTQRVTNLERTMASMRQLTNMMITRITTVTTQATETAAELETLSLANDELRQENAELQAMLGTFERFFGSLLVESPGAFDPAKNAVERMDALNAFLGNTEARLAGLRPNPQTVPTNDTVDPEELGRVLTELTAENTDLNQKVTKLAKQLEVGAFIGDRSLTGGSDDVFTADQCINSLQTLEAQVNALVATQLEADADRRVSGSEGVISDRDREILEGSVYGGDRGVTSVRKSVFSVAATRPLVSDGTHLTVEFDHIFVNKGNHWNSTSHTFKAGITGYYFFYFTLRSYDGRYMGVSLMKNGERITALYTEKSTRNVMDSQGLVLPLEIGDEVHLLLGPSTEYALDSSSNKYCTFSGFLVYKGL